MPIYTCLTTDDRYAAPSLSFRTAADETAARRAGREDLAANPHHRAVEILDGERPVSVEARQTCSTGRAPRLGRAR